jgi:dipeptidyl aminopeptidase/acylaminoacyl peptidase
VSRRATASSEALRSALVAYCWEATLGQIAVQMKRLSWRAKPRRCARVLIAAVALSGALQGCERSPAHPALSDAKLIRLIPAYEFVFNRQAFDGFSFSPDGTRLAWTGPSGWSRALHVRSEASGVVNVFKVGGSGMHWSADSRRLLILDDKSGAENHHLLRLDVDDRGATAVDLTPHSGVRVWLHQILTDDPEHVLVLHNRRNRKLRDLYRVNLSTAAEELVAQNPGDGVAPITDSSGTFKGWSKPTSTSRPRGKPRAAPFKPRTAIAVRRDEVTRVVGVSRDRSRAWVLSNRNRERIALFSVDTKTNAGRLVHQDERVDITGVRMSKVQGKPLLVSSVSDYPHSVILDGPLQDDLRALLDGYRGKPFGFDIVSMDPSEQRLVIMVYTHSNRSFYLLDRTHKRHTLLGESRSPQFRAAMVEPEAVEIRTRDSLTLPGYLLRPVGSGAMPVPLVILVHGGPWQRVAWSDQDHSADLLRAQFLANRGYAVLAINYRGSKGYGQSFMAAAVGEFGAKMQDDLIDGAQWAVARGIADPQRIAVMGHSYGGYATLMALAQHPQKFACGIDIAGPTDLAKLIETFPPYWEIGHWRNFVGDPAVASDRSRMDKISPVNLANQIERPLLIIQGQHDVRVRPEQSTSMVEALRKAGKAVDYLTFADMGHSLSYWAHHLAVLRASEHFLADCLGGRAARLDPLEWVARLSGRLPLTD